MKNLILKASMFAMAMVFAATPLSFAADGGGGVGGINGGGIVMDRSMETTVCPFGGIRICCSKLDPHKGCDMGNEKECRA